MNVLVEHPEALLLDRLQQVGNGTPFGVARPVKMTTLPQMTFSPPCTPQEDHQISNAAQGRDDKV